MGFFYQLGTMLRADSQLFCHSYLEWILNFIITLSIGLITGYNFKEHNSKGQTDSVFIVILILFPFALTQTISKLLVRL